MTTAGVEVEVVYALAAEQRLLKLVVPAGTTVRGAIEQSGILREYPQIDLAQARVGRWNQLVTLDEAVGAGDRIEIYRPLVADPKQQRRDRAAKARKGI